MKKRIIACVLACAMLLLGTGYAYWTDKIDIGTTAKTGKLDVAFDTTECLTGTVKSEIDYDTYTGIDFADLAKVSCTALTKDASTVNFVAEGMFPGFAQRFTVPVVNNGTVAAKLGKIDGNAIEVNDPVLKDLLGISIEAINNKETLGFACFIPYYTNSKETIVAKDFFANKANTFVIAGRTYVRLSALEKIDFAVAEQYNNILFVQPGSRTPIAGIDQVKNTIDITFCVGMDPDAAGNYTTGSTSVMSGKSDAASQLKTATFNVSFLWDQFNQ